MADLTPRTRSESFLNGEDLKPITRREHFYAGRENELPEGHQNPETREEWFIQKYREAGDVTVESLSITENGTYTAPSGKAYSPVSVNVPLPSNAYLLQSIEHEQVATFTDGTDNFLKSLEIAIEPVQSGSGEPSPTNIRPISGWTACNVVRTGKNIWGGLPLAQDMEQVAYQPTLDTTNKTLIFTNTKPIEGSYTNPIPNGISYKENTQYTFIIAYKNNGMNNCLRISYTDGNYEVIELVNSSNTKIFKVFTTQSNKTIKDIILSYYTNAQTYLYYEESGLFEGVITADDFEPYSGNTYTLTFTDGTNPLTVYYGTVDLISGELIVNVPQSMKVKLSSLNWTYHSNTSRFRVDLPTGAKKPSTSSEIPQYFKCECYRPNNYLSYKNGDITITSSGDVFVKDNNYTDTTTWLNTVGDYYVTFPLATPLTYQLSKQQIRSLVGENNISANTGDSIVDYRKLWVKPEM